MPDDEKNPEKETPQPTPQIPPEKKPIPDEKPTPKKSGLISEGDNRKKGDGEIISG